MFTIAPAIADCQVIGEKPQLKLFSKTTIKIKVIYRQIHPRLYILSMFNKCHQCIVNIIDL